MNTRHLSNLDESDDESSFDVVSAMLDAGPSPAAERARTLVGTVVSGRYQVRELIAMGGMGAVYRGEHIH
ncbi:MAG TPA: hypothetical protein VFS00_21710, partial [Polyangiaceae bacterium]|nr:hypothetical protein [Polyangiaceae bacterium]